MSKPDRRHADEFRLIITAQAAGVPVSQPLMKQKDGSDSQSLELITPALRLTTA
jgi:hypothetical protein